MEIRSYAWWGGLGNRNCTETNDCLDNLSLKDGKGKSREVGKGKYYFLTLLINIKDFSIVLIYYHDKYFFQKAFFFFFIKALNELWEKVEFHLDRFISLNLPGSHLELSSSLVYFFQGHAYKPRSPRSHTYPWFKGFPWLHFFFSVLLFGGHTIVCRGYSWLCLRIWNARDRIQVCQMQGNLLNPQCYHSGPPQAWPFK